MLSTQPTTRLAGTERQDAQGRAADPPRAVLEQRLARHRIREVRRLTVVPLDAETDIGAFCVGEPHFVDGEPGKLGDAPSGLQAVVQPLGVVFAVLDQFGAQIAIEVDQNPVLEGVTNRGFGQRRVGRRISLGGERVIDRHPTERANGDQFVAADDGVVDARFDARLGDLGRRVGHLCRRSGRVGGGLHSWWSGLAGRIVRVATGSERSDQADHPCADYCSLPMPLHRRNTTPGRQPPRSARAGPARPPRRGRGESRLAPSPSHRSSSRDAYPARATGRGSMPGNQ